MKQNFKKKVCLIVDCLSGGGAERAAASLSIQLSKLNYRVSIIALRDEISYDYQGVLYNLGTNESAFKIKKQYDKFCLFKKAYREANADVYIDFRMRNRFVMEHLFHSFVFDMNKMIMSIRSFKIFFHIPNSTFFYKAYNKSKAIVGVSEAITSGMEQLYDFNNLKSIPNFYNPALVEKIKNSVVSVEQQDFVIAVGRLDNNVKQFDKLILSYKSSSLIAQGVSLIILGEGKDRSLLELLIEENGLTDYVSLLGFTPDIPKYMIKAKFSMLCSKFEGFPNVILES